MRLARLFTLVGSVALAAACGGSSARAHPVDPPAPAATAPTATTDAPAPIGLVHLQTTTGVSTIGLDGRTRVERNAVASADGMTLFAVEGESLRTLNGNTGAERARQALPTPDLHPIVSSPDGRWVALADSADRVGDGALPPGRTRSTIVVASASPSSAESPRAYDLTGNLVPEAFSPDGQLLFVIEYTPAETPANYRVRILRLGTGAVEPPFTFAKEVDAEEMQGQARTQVMSPDRHFLYTLYTRGDEPGGYPVVHVLSLDGGQVHCIDLPAELGLTNGGAIAVSPEGGRLYVLGPAGALAEIDASQPFRQDADPFPIIARVDLPPGGGETGDNAVALAVDRDRVWAGLGDQVVAVDRDGLRPGRRITVGGPLRALAVSGAGPLVSAVGDGLEMVDPSTGAHHWLAMLDGRVERLSVQP